MSQIIDYQEELEKCHTMEDITGPDGLIQRVIRDAVEQVMNREMEDHIAEEKENGRLAVRNGTSPKTLKTSYGNIAINVPRTREAGFEPEIIKKRSVVEEGMEEQIISMYAKGMNKNFKKCKLLHISDKKYNELNLFLLQQQFTNKELTELLMQLSNHSTATITTYKKLEQQLKKIKESGII